MTSLRVFAQIHHIVGFQHFLLALAVSVGSGLCLVIAPARAELLLNETIEQSIANIRDVIRQESSGIRGGRGEPIFDRDGFFYQSSPSAEFSVDYISATGEQSVFANEALIRNALEKQSRVPLNPEEWQLKSGDFAARTISFSGPDGEWRIDLDGGEAERIKEEKCGVPRLLSDQYPTTFGPKYEVASNDGCRFVTVVDRNLWIRNGKTDQSFQLTEDGTERLTWGGSEESAPGLNVYWSPDGNYIAAILLDERNVPHEPLPRYLASSPTIDRQPYSRAGEPLALFRLYVFDLDKKTKVEIDVPQTGDHYVNIVGWQANGEEIVYQIVDRTLKSVKVMAADRSSAKSRTLFTLKSRTYIDTQYTLGISPVVTLDVTNGPLSDGLLVISEETGFRSLYAYGANGKKIARLTDGTSVVHRIVAVDQQRGVAYVEAAGDPNRPYDSHLLVVKLDGSGATRITPSSGAHKVWLSPDYRYFVSRRSTVLSSPVVEMRNMDGSLIKVIDETDVEGLMAMGFSGAEEFWTTSVDGEHEFKGVLIKPYNAKAGEKYPIVNMAYGGMQLLRVPRYFYGFGALNGGYNSVPARVLLHHGIGVVFIDAPGTPGRGREFQDATYGTWPQGVIDNHKKWILDAAVTRPWMDTNRVGIYGSSWGGYMAIRGLVDAPDFFSAAVAMSAPQDFVDHPVYIEPFMDTPERNPTGYNAASNFQRIDEIKAPVLAMSFPLDVNAGYSPFMKFVDAMVLAEKDIEVFTIPEVNHRITCCGEAREYFTYALITRFLRRHLGEPVPSSSTVLQP